MKDTFQDSLAGKILISMPGVDDPFFQRSVVYLCAHSDTGAMGLVVNKRKPGARLMTLLEDLDLQTHAVGDRAVYVGGPIEPERGFVLHSTDYVDGDATLVVNRGFAMTATTRVLADIAADIGPDQWLVSLGYAGWDGGQLEDEILRNSWLTLTPGPALVFSQRDDAKWSDALALMGVTPQVLSGASGRA